MSRMEELILQTVEEFLKEEKLTTSSALFAAIWRRWSGSRDFRSVLSKLVDEGKLEMDFPEGLAVYLPRRKSELGIYPTRNGLVNFRFRSENEAEVDRAIEVAQSVVDHEEIVRFEGGIRVSLLTKKTGEILRRRVQRAFPAALDATRGF